MINGATFFWVCFFFMTVLMGLCLFQVQGKKKEIFILNSVMSFYDKRCYIVLGLFFFMTMLMGFSYSVVRG